MALEPEIAQAMVHGDRRPHLVALIVPNPDLARGLAGDEGKLRAAVGEAVARANRSLSSIERVKRFALAAEPFSIDNGEMTPTQKIRRHVIGARYRYLLDELY